MLAEDRSSFYKAPPQGASRALSSRGALLGSPLIEACLAHNGRKPRRVSFNLFGDRRETFLTRHSREEEEEAEGKCLRRAVSSETEGDGARRNGESVRGIFASEAAPDFYTESLSPEKEVAGEKGSAIRAAVITFGRHFYVT